MTEVLERTTKPSSTDNAETGRPQREGLIAALRECGFYDRLPRIREDSKAYLLKNRERLLEYVPETKMTPAQAATKYDQFRSRTAQADLLEVQRFTLTSLDPQSQPNAQDLPAQNMIQYGSVDMVGNGLGFNNLVIGLSFLFPFGFLSAGSGTGTSDRRALSAEWSFSFTPPFDGFYRISTGLIASGKYVLISDDGPFDSHEVRAQVSSGLWALNASKSNDLFSRGDDNINEADTFAVSDTLEIMVEAKAGVKFDIGAAIVATVAARGDDTFAQIDMTQAAGGMLCPGVSVVQY